MHFWPGKIIPVNKYATTDEIMYNIWITFILVVPLHRQKEVVEIYKDYNKNKEEIVQFLDNLSNLPESTREDTAQIRPEFDSEVDPDKRILKLLELSKNRALNNLNKNGVLLTTDKNAEVELHKNITENFKYLIGNETGGSLYKIYKKMLTTKE